MFQENRTHGLHILQCPFVPRWTGRREVRGLCGSGRLPSRHMPRTAIAQMLQHQSPGTNQRSTNRRACVARRFLNRTPSGTNPFARFD